MARLAAEVEPAEVDWIRKLMEAKVCGRCRLKCQCTGQEYFCPAMDLLYVMAQNTIEILAESGVIPAVKDPVSGFLAISAVKRCLKDLLQDAEGS